LRAGISSSERYSDPFPHMLDATGSIA